MLNGNRLIAVIRRPEYSQVDKIVLPLLEAGIRAVEFTCTGSGAADAAREAKRLSADITVGLGSVRSQDELEQAITAGVDFAVSPALDEDLVSASREQVLFLPGVWTPTEVTRAQRLGCPAVKLFPARTGGPAHLRDLRMLFPGLAIVPSGGVEVDDVADYLRAGATAVCLGSELVGSATAPLDSAEIRTRAIQVTGLLAEFSSGAGLAKAPVQRRPTEQQ
jgi:2-dehydro-3-deoxyphosphogluconate aldolase / (4S)-4-hydroxy-2-oxoglutarate aldolase